MEGNTTWPTIMTSNNALERTVEQRGPRLAREGGPCTAAQLGR
jgi:hypothetical protein